ncbi:NADP-dependent oxidoreductase [Jatrophihabitans sp. DSM 45814]
MAKAVRFDKYGDVDVLYVADVDVPAAVAGEVVVKVAAAGINPGEASIRNGYLEAIFPSTFPSGEGSDLAGVVHAVGEGVTEFSVGDEVLGWSDRRSSHAEYVTVPVEQLISKPPNMPWEVAGSMYVVAVTAYAAVRAVSVKPGDTVVVSAAAGGVGSLVVQLLKIKGANVIGIASEPNHAWLTEHGVTPVSYPKGGADVESRKALADRLRAVAPQGIDAFIDLFGPEYVHLAAELGIAPERIETIISWDAAREYGAKTEGSSDASTTAVLAEMAGLVASGQIELPIAATFSLDEVKQAYAELEKRHTRGKIVLIP